MPFPEKPRFNFRLLQALALALGGLTLYALALELGWFEVDAPDVKLVDSERALTLFAAMSGLVLGLERHAQNVRPYLIYERKRVFESDAGLPERPEGYWQISVRNGGKGLALLRRAAYLRDGTRVHLQGLEVELRKKGLKAQEEYALRRVSPGFGLAPDVKWTVAEIACDKLAQWSDMTLKIYFESVLGDGYKREIHIGPPG